ncbi:MAG: amidohydrolase family protein [Thermoanaerobaculia bacterium]|nr:amidohydrolase family protein [Thermoanaerobaculia bacterium]
MKHCFYNAHAHCFTIDHVPEYFIGKWVAVSWLLSRRWFVKMVQEAPLTGRFGFLGSLIKGLVNLLLGFEKQDIIRYLNLVRFGYAPGQREVIRRLREYYPKSAGFALLSVDLEYMGAGTPKKRYAEQLAELAGIQQDPEFSEVIYPFLCCDPRRLQPQTPREKAVEQDFTGERFWSAAREYLAGGTFRGIKLYPAIGFFPFDKRLKPVYDLALALDLPIVVHSEIGTVHLKYKPTEAERFHPFLNTVLPNRKPRNLQPYYTHPLNWECLLNRDLLRQYWGDDAPDYSRLKVCFGHWGGIDNWHHFLDDAWSEVAVCVKDCPCPSLELGNWHIEPREGYKNYSWFSIICDLMRKYPNVYADISYLMSDTTLLPMLKMILEADPEIRDRALFGTDFYMVSTATTERSFSINVRAFLGAEMFEQIAKKNVEGFLNRRVEKAETRVYSEQLEGMIM